MEVYEKNTDGIKALKLIDELEEQNETNKKEILKIKNNITVVETGIKNNSNNLSDLNNQITELQNVVNNLGFKSECKIDDLDKNFLDLRKKVENGLNTVCANYFFEARLTADSTYFVARLRAKDTHIATLKFKYLVKNYVAGETGDGKVEFYLDGTLINENSFTFNDDNQDFEFEYSFMPTGFAQDLTLKTYHLSKSGSSNMRFNISYINYSLSGCEAFNYEYNYAETVCAVENAEGNSVGTGAYILSQRSRYPMLVFLNEKTKEITDLNSYPTYATNKFFNFPSTTSTTSPTSVKFDIFQGYHKDLNDEINIRPVSYSEFSDGSFKIGGYARDVSALNPVFKVDWIAGTAIFNQYNHKAYNEKYTPGNETSSTLMLYLVGLTYFHVVGEAEDQIRFAPLTLHSYVDTSYSAVIETGLTGVSGGFSVADIKDNKYDYYAIMGLTTKDDNFYILPVFSGELKEDGLTSDFLIKAYSTPLHIGNGRNITARIIDNVVRFYYTRLGKIYTKEVNLDNKEISKERYVIDGQYMLESKYAYYIRKDGVLKYVFKDEL